MGHQQRSRDGRWWAAGVAAIGFVVCSACASSLPRYDLSADDCRAIVDHVEATRETIAAFDKVTGKELWRADAGYGRGYSSRFSPSPVINDGVVHVLRLGPNAPDPVLVGLDPADGRELWSTPVGGKGDGPIFVYGADSVAVSRESRFGGYAIVNSATGKRSDDEAWTIVPDLKPDQAGGIFVASKSKIALLDPVARVRAWETELPPRSGPGTSLNVDSATVVDGALVIQTRGEQGGTFAVDIKSGARLWEDSRRLTELVGPGPVEEQQSTVVLKTGDAEVSVIDVRTGREVQKLSGSEAERVMKLSIYSSDHRRVLNAWSGSPIDPGRINSVVEDDDRAFVSFSTARSGPTPAEVALFESCTQAGGHVTPSSVVPR